MSDFRQHRERGDVQRQLAHLRPEHVAAQADEVAALEVAPVGKAVVADFVFAHVELKPAGAVGDVGKDRLAHRAFGEQAPGQRPGFGLGVLSGH